MGGAWKVAYADLVTGLFALFMCLWLTSVDQEVMSEISEYFKNPNTETVQASPGTIDILNANVAASRRASFSKPALVPKRLIRKTTENIEKSYVQSPEFQENENMHVEVIDEGVKLNLFGTSQRPFFNNLDDGLSEYGNVIVNSLGSLLSRKYDKRGQALAPMEIEIEGFAPERNDGKAWDKYPRDPWTASMDQAIMIRNQLLQNGVRTNYIKKIVGYGDKHRVPSDATNKIDQSVSIIIRNKK